MLRKVTLAILTMVLAGGFIFAANFYLPIKMAALFPPPPVKMPKVIPSRAPESIDTITAEPEIPVYKKIPLIEPFDSRIPPQLEKAVDFWEKIYSKYSDNEVVLHDAKTLEIYTVLDFSKLISSNLSAVQKEKIEEVYIEQERRKILDLIPELEERLRAQNGQSDQFARAIKRSGEYMREIESIFDAYGLPRELTRIIFVESMFQPNATSGVGAKGIWQFMPKTAGHFMTVTSLIDERLDPIISTHAAAKLMKRNFYDLGTWPLTINAYNSGKDRMKTAVKKLGTRNIATIIEYYSHPGYGFASRNFYPEFLAALRIYEDRTRYFPGVTPDNPVRYEIITLPSPASMAEIAEILETDVEELARLNPAFSDVYFDENRYLKEGTKLRVGEDGHSKFALAMEDMWKTAKDHIWHTVGAGETIKDIALKYNTPISDILKLNNIEQNNIFIGQALKIPLYEEGN